MGFITHANQRKPSFGLKPHSNSLKMYVLVQFCTCNHGRGKTDDSELFQMTITNTAHEDKPHKVIAEKVGCLQGAVIKYINGKLTGREKCGTRRCISNSHDCSADVDYDA